MKILISDFKMLHKFQIPEISESLHMINFKFHTENDVINETITLRSEENKWVIYADDKLTLLVGGYSVDKVELENNMYFGIKFANIENFVPVYILDNNFDYNAYIIKNNDELYIGSGRECTIKIAKSSEKSVLLQKNDNHWFAIRISEPYLSYINSQYYNAMKLYNGDVLFVEGVKIIFMNNVLLIESKTKEIQVNLPDFDYGSVGNKEEELTPVTEIEKSLKLFNDDEIFVHSPRLKNIVEQENIVIDEPPAKDNSVRTPAIFTLGSSVLLFLASGSSIITAITNYKKDKSDKLAFILELFIFGITFISSVFLPFLLEKWEKYMTKKRENTRQQKYQQYLSEKSDYVFEILRKQEETIKANNYSLQQIISNINNKSNDIWNREIVDEDFLNITLGIGDVPAKITINIPDKKFTLDDDNLLDMVHKIKETKLVLTDVPVTVSLTENLVMPLVINSTFRDDYIKGIMLQLMYYYSGKDLKIVIITNENNKNKWEYMMGLPHNWNEDYSVRYFASNEEDLQQLSMILEQEYENRIKEKKESGSDITYKNFDNYFLIVTDDYKMARELSVVNKIIDNSENIGISLLILESSLKVLPSRFNIMVSVRDKECVIINKNSLSKDVIPFNSSFIPNLDINALAMIIANIPVMVRSSSSQIPDTLGFLEMFNAGRVDQLNVLSRWKTNDSTTSLKTLIGYKENNKNIELDLHEKYHGPHGLIAGSTGSGKSEFLITYILSMAVNYHPYEVQFVLIDYKGGGLAGAFENKETGIKLPHLVGTITNLDKSEMDRTLVSIKSELQRRQKVFNSTRLKLDEGTIDIYKYQRLYREGKVTNPMAHLFIICDEFAELKAQQPDFMDELVSAARIGRSLGVHLILATQKPSGVVDDQIWTNTRFRVCLKVQTTEDSSELLKRNDAAYIKEAGRFYLQVGNDELFELGQSGWAGAKYIPTDNVVRKIDDSIDFLSNTGYVIKEINEEVKREEEVSYGDQLSNLVKYIHELAKREGVVTHNLWLDNIPSTIYYNDLIKKYETTTKPFIIDSIIGEYDDPSNQTQGVVILPINKCGNTQIVGISGSGKTTLLSTIIYSAIINHNSDEINFYIIDLGSEKLNVFSKAPQVGEFLTAIDQDKIKFLFYMLKDEKEKRFSYYAKTGREYIKDVEQGNSVFPTIVVIINDFDVFKEQFEDLYDYEFIPFTRNCSKVGIIFIISSTRSSALGYMAENSFPTKIMLNMADQDEYNMFMGTCPIPSKNAGRGIIKINDINLEFQVPLLFEEQRYEKSLNYVLLQLSSHLNKRARRVPVIPDEVTIDIIKNRIQSIDNLPLGINVKTAQISTFNFNNILNIIASSSHATAKKFFTKFAEILSYIKNTKIIIINSIKDVNIEVPENIKYFDSSFKKVLEIIDGNIDKYLQEQKEEEFLIIFIGYAKLQKSLLLDEDGEDDDDDDNDTTMDMEKEGVITINSIVKKAKAIKNFHFVIYDTERNINKLENSDIEVLFKRKDGIWLGKDFDSQSLFETLESFPDATNANTITLVENKKTQNIRFN